MVTVLTAGHVNWDVTFRLDRLPEPDGEATIHDQHGSGGGSAANVACALAALGLEADLVGSVGTDPLGELARRELEDAGVRLDGLLEVEDLETTVKYLLVDDHGEVSVLGNEGANEAFGPDDIADERVRAADHVHLTSQRPETAAAIARVATDAGVSVSVDLGRRVGDRNYRDTLALADVIFASQHEADALFDGELVHAVADDRDVALVVTCGAAGAEVYTRDGRSDYPGFAVDAVDTAGAGDAFAAGFIAKSLEERAGEGRLRDVLTDRTTRRHVLEFANACGALAAISEGARSAPTRGGVRTFLESARISN
ncbi:carbohydrate kinase family protein [Natronobiforma cellulositropha]|uniref:carbohydrate kinase family protein n=1 Tax=Natronobiforma cellulositropha TaxID=1679076 RepID=UPI0021D5EF53|nr:carbohydrate kinase family protein [Natronobiforma cellulositropha]